jgi:hypothetical protein
VCCIGLGTLPFFDFSLNQARANIAVLAFNLQITTLRSGHHAKAGDIKRWRYRLFRIAGKTIIRARRNVWYCRNRRPGASYAQGTGNHDGGARSRSNVATAG